VDVAAHDDETDGEGNGEDEADGSPYEGPEGGGDEDGDGGQSGVAAVDVGFGVVGCDDFHDREEGEDEDGVFPSVKDGDREEGGSECGDGSSDVWDESAKGGERSEEEGVGKPDEVERDADDGAVDDIDGDLKEEVAGDALRCVTHGLRHECEVAIARETDKAIAEVFALEENEKREDDGEEGSGERFEDAAELIETAGGAANFADLEGMFRRSADGLLRGFAGGLKGSGGGGVYDAELVADLFEFALQAADGGVAGAVECLELGGDVVAVDGEFVGDDDELGEEYPRGNEEECGECADDEQGRGRAWETEALEEGHDRGEQEREENGDSKGQEKDFGEKEDGDGEYGNGDKPELRQKACGG